MYPHRTVCALSIAPHRRGGLGSGDRSSSALQGESNSVELERGGGCILMIVRGVMVCTGKRWGTACTRGQVTCPCTSLSSSAQRPLVVVKKGR